MLVACLLSVCVLAAGAFEPARTFLWDARKGMAALPRGPCGTFLGLCDPETRREIVERQEAVREAYAERLRLLTWLVPDPTPLTTLDPVPSNGRTIGWIPLPLRRRLEE